jgi:hypothetical protein
MLSRKSGPLVLILVTAAVLASTPPALSFPFFGKSRCKDEKTRLQHEEQILRDRQQLALHQCHSTLEAGHDRCRSLKRRQQGELKSFRDQRDRRLEECKRGTKDSKQDGKDEKKTHKKTPKK